MIDALDKQTQSLTLEPVKRGRGRPKTGSAMTPAEKQRAYRERIKGNVTGNMHKAVAEDLRVQLQNAMEEIEALKGELRKRGRTIVEQARMLQAVEQEKSNVTKKQKKTYVCAIQKKSPKGQWRTKCRYETHMAGNTAYLEVCEGEMAHLYRIINLK